MSNDGAAALTCLLQAAAEGDTAAREQILPILYAELHKLAQGRMRQLGPGHTLQPTALVHEAYMHLLGDTPVQWQNRRHFFAAAARAMRNILVDHARARATRKRGGALRRMPLADSDVALTSAHDEDVLAVHEALSELEREHPQHAELLQLRFFAGLSRAETAAALDVSEKTVERDWRFVKAWLQRWLRS